MAIELIEGAKFEGVDFGTAPGTDPGYVIGFTPVSPLLFVDEGERSAKLIGVKFYHHAMGDNRGADRPADDKHAVTMLVSKGRWEQAVWNDKTGESVKVLLTEPGDYIVWRPGFRHSWFPHESSTMLTVRWKPARQSSEDEIHAMREIAVKMYDRQHDRWTQWAAFFFTAIAGVFLLWAHVKEYIPLWVASAVAASISIAWVSTGLGLRASTQGWLDVVKDLEAGKVPAGGLFREFESRRNAFRHWRDFLGILMVFSPRTCLHVTRVLVLLGVLSTCIFGYLTIASFLDHRTDEDKIAPAFARAGAKDARNLDEPKAAVATDERP